MKGVRVTLILDKTEHWKAIDLLMPILRTPRVTSVLIVESTRYKSWKSKPNVDKEIYVPRIWRMAAPFLAEMVEQPPDSPLYYRLINYLDFRAQGLPKQFLDVLSAYYQGKRDSSNMISKMLYKNKLHSLHFLPFNLPRLIISPECSIEIMSVGSLHKCICQSEDDILTNKEGKPLLIGASDEETDRLRTFLYSSLFWLAKEAQKGEWFGFQKLVEILASQDNPGLRIDAQTTASNIVRRLEADGKVIRGRKGLNVAEIYGRTIKMLSEDWSTQ
jgi:hypothetical protein